MMILVKLSLFELYGQIGNCISGVSMYRSFMRDATGSILLFVSPQVK